MATRCKLCNSVMVIIDSEGTKACINGKCDRYAGKDLNNPKHSVKKNTETEKIKNKAK